MIYNLTFFSQNKATVKNGQLKVQQNVLARRQHNEELALGIAKGPVSALHRSAQTPRYLTSSNSSHHVGQYLRVLIDL